MFITIAIVVIVVLMCVYIFYKTNYEPSTPMSSATYRQTTSDAQAKRNFQIVMYQRMIERFNDFYDLDLYDGDIYEISRSHSPLIELGKYVSAGTPSLEESYQSLVRTAHMLSHGIGLSSDEAESLEKSMNEFISELFEAEDASDLLELYTLKEENCTPECLYLIGKINYFSIILSFLEYYANETDNDYLKQKHKEIFEKNQSIF